MSAPPQPWPRVVIHERRFGHLSSIPVAVQVDDVTIAPTSVAIRASTGGDQFGYEVTLTFWAHSIETVEAPK